MTNIARIRAKDKIVCNNGKTYEVKECWVANGIIQLVTEEEPDNILTYNINGIILGDKAGMGYGISDFIETKLPDDDTVYYIPRFGIDLLPVLHVNGEEKIIMQLLDLNGLEVKGDQTLKAEYKYVIVATLNKKLGRDMTQLKQERIICNSKEECQERLEKISSYFKGDKPEDFDEELKKLMTSNGEQNGTSN